MLALLGAVAGSLIDAAPSLADEAVPIACLSVLRRVPTLPVPLCPLALAAGAGYGYTEAVLGTGDRHHRFAGEIAGEWAAHPTLALGLRLAGRYDRHAPGGGATGGGATGGGATGGGATGGGATGGGATDDGWTGEPRVYARASRAHAGTTLGLALGVNLPGGEAPSIDTGAIGGDLTASASRAAGPVALTGALGYRLDRSARALPAPAQLSPADRVGLGVNEADALLLGVGVEHRRPSGALFAEASLDLLLGARAPAWRASPMRIGIGARRPVARATAAEVLFEIVPSARASLAPAAPLYDVAPRVSLRLGLIYGAAPVVARLVAPPPPPAPAPVSESARGQLRGMVRSYGGRGLSATIRVTPLARDGVDRPPLLVQSRVGDFAVDLAPGPHEVVIEATGYLAQRRRVVIEENGVVLLNVDLRRGR